MLVSDCLFTRDRHMLYRRSESGDMEGTSRKRDQSVNSTRILLATNLTRGQRVPLFLIAVRPKIQLCEGSEHITDREQLMDDISAGSHLKRTVLLGRVKARRKSGASLQLP